MTLATAAEYHAIAASLAFEGRAFIDGRFVPATSGATMETINPATGETIASVASGQAEEVERAVAAARRAFRDGTCGTVAIDGFMEGDIEPPFGGNRARSRATREPRRWRDTSRQRRAGST